MTIGNAIVENKATNPISVRVLNIAFDFCFRRVTEEGYKPSRLFFAESDRRGIKALLHKKADGLTW